jgi:hypothetical protein
MPANIFAGVSVRSAIFLEPLLVTVLFFKSDYVESDDVEALHILLGQTTRTAHWSRICHRFLQYHEFAVHKATITLPMTR